MKHFKERCLDDVYYKDEISDCNPVLQRLYAYLLMSPMKTEMIDVSINRHGNIVFVVSTAVIRKFKKTIQSYFQNDIEVLEVMENVLCGKLPQCDNCGSITLNTSMLTYRDNGGCVGRRCECLTCIGIQGDGYHRLSDEARTDGTVAAKQYFYDREKQHRLKEIKKYDVNV